MLVCVDATQVARSAYLARCSAQELGCACVVALTMVDEAGPAAPDAKALAAELGCEVVRGTARTRGVGVRELVAAVDRALASGPAEPHRPVDAVAGAGRG